MHPLLYSWREELSFVLVRGLAVLCGLAVLSVVSAWLVQTPPAAAAKPQPNPDWTEIERPHPAFALSIPEAADVPANYRIRRHTLGGGRMDILSLGASDGAGPNLHVEIYRPGHENFRFAGLAAETVARARELEPVQVAMDDVPVDSKFGPLATATFLTAKGTPRRCLGFARSFDDPALQMFGWFCQGAQPGSQLGVDAFISRATLACALDRLSLLSAGSEPKVGALFAQAELHRSFCGQKSPLLAPTPRHRALWKAAEAHAAAR